MDFGPLRTWLNLPPGPWPPDHYALLGLPPGDGDPAAVEARVLDRMDALRPHQLVQPDLVTEGMNRLAQALVCLTDPAARDAYDAALIGGPAPAPVRKPLPAAVPPPPPPAPPDPPPTFALDADPPDAPDDPTDRTQVFEVPFSPGLEPPVPYSLAEHGPPTTLPPDEPELEPLPLPDAPPGAVLPRADRRAVFRRLAAARRVLRAWADLRSTLADPDERFDNPAAVLALVRGARALRPALEDAGDDPDDVRRPGGRVAAVVRQPLVLATVRTFLPEQRAALAVDWRRGQLEWEAEYARLRRGVRARSRGRKGSGDWRAAGRWLARNPEAAVVAVGGLALFVAAARTLVGR